jgi:hypothetical protein
MRNAARPPPNGRLTMAFSAWSKPPWSVSPKTTSVEASNALRFGAFGTTLMVPPMEPDPYKVPCGPRSTSTRLRS